VHLDGYLAVTTATDFGVSMPVVVAGGGGVGDGADAEDPPPQPVWAARASNNSGANTSRFIRVSLSIRHSGIQAFSAGAGEIVSK
jgi:hypothetical protein